MTAPPAIDALIIGAGPAGSLAALLLARAGLRVTLVEQHAFPRDKVCGECLSALGIQVLSRCKLTDLPLSPVPLTRAFIHAPDGSSCQVRLPHPMWGLSRSVLDNHLLTMAKAAGATVLQPARCEGQYPAVLIRDLIDNHIDSLDAKVVLRADGKSPSGQATRDFGIKAHFVDVDGPRDAIELFAVTGSYGGLAPIEGGRWNAAFSVPAERLRFHHGDIEALFAEVTNENAALARRLRTARRTGAWLASPLPRFGVEKVWPDNVIPIGNAAAAIEPIGGEGMGLALASAELAATALIDARRRGSHINLDRLRREYRCLWALRGTVCRIMAMAVSCRSVATYVAPAIDGCEAVSRAAMAMMGK
jgi:flavin-dependent dehydrogenase